MIRINEIMNKDDLISSIIRSLVAAGAHVRSLEVGEGFPDLIIGFQGHNFLMTVKDPEYDITSLSPTQIAWIEDWPGLVFVIDDEEQALYVLNYFSNAVDQISNQINKTIIGGDQ